MHLGRLWNRLCNDDGGIDLKNYSNFMTLMARTKRQPLQCLTRKITQLNPRCRVCAYSHWMTYEPWPRHIYAALLRRAASLLGGRNGADRALRPHAVFDPYETRRYGGIWAKDLVVAASDQTALNKGEIRPGAAQRMLTRTKAFLRALQTYLSVKRALAIWETPLMEGYASHLLTERRTPPTARKPYIWRTPAPTAKTWRQAERCYGFDIRATSPSHIARAVHRERTKLRNTLINVHGADTAASRRDTSSWQGPPAARDYNGPDDLFTVWPPVFLAPPVVDPVEDMNMGHNRQSRPFPFRGGSGLLATAKRSIGVNIGSYQETDVPFLASRLPAPTSTVVPIAFATSPSQGEECLHFPKPCALQSQYLWARIMYGEAGVTNFLGTLRQAEQALIENFEQALCRSPP